ncbi:hypothetical protein D9M69_722720 [compost metagenome]
MTQRENATTAASTASIWCGLKASSPWRGWYTTQLACAPATTWNRPPSLMRRWYFCTTAIDSRSVGDDCSR